MNGRFLYRGKLLGLLLGVICLLLVGSGLLMANHRGSECHAHVEERHSQESEGHSIPGAPFQVYWAKGKANEGEILTSSQVQDAIQAVVKAFREMVADRARYPRFDEALTKRVLKQVTLEPRVFNRDGKEFLFLVARTKQKGKVTLLINVTHLQERGYVKDPAKLIPVLAREFQWVLSKADTTKKRKALAGRRELTHAPIQTNKNIDHMSGAEREKALHALFEQYLTTVDEYDSLKNQPYYDVGAIVPVNPTQKDSTTKFYDIRVREALQRIVRESHFQKQTPKAVRSLLNGKIWNVAFVNIESRDWATRTRVLPRDKAVKAGKKLRVIQPAKILINLHRKAAPEDPYHSLTNGLPMGALSTEQLAQVIALEIEHQIIEKSMRGHVASDEQSSPQ